MAETESLAQAARSVSMQPAAPKRPLGECVDCGEGLAVGKVGGESAATDAAHTACVLRIVHEPRALHRSRGGRSMVCCWIWSCSILLCLFFVYTVGRRRKQAGCQTTVDLEPPPTTQPECNQLPGKHLHVIGMRSGRLYFDFTPHLHTTAYCSTTERRRCLSFLVGVVVVVVVVVAAVVLPHLVVGCCLPPRTRQF